MKAGEETVVLTKVEYEKLKSLEHELAELKRMVFGSKSERFVGLPSVDQLGLFEQEKQESTPLTEQITYQRKKTDKKKEKPVRCELPAHLPREEEILEPKDLEKGSKKIGEEVTEILEHIPGKLYVRRIIRPKYVKEDKEGVSIASLPSLPIPKGNAGAGLLAHIQVSKWVDHLPFYRQVQMFKREKMRIAESTINGWFTATCNLLEPLYDELVKEVKAQNYLQADESPIRVQDSHKKGTTHIGYQWVYHAPIQRLVVFDYQPSRSKQGVGTFLQDFEGSLQTDGYTAYNGLAKTGKVMLLACMAHARRYFEKALDNDKQTASHALGVIQELYIIERSAKEENYTADQLKEIRQQQALPILHDWKLWLDEQQQLTTPKSPIGKAVNYTLGLWSRLLRYIENGDYQIDNNRIENAIRPLALGRKNYLFAGSHNAAQRAAMMYSFFATCKTNQVNPYEWLKGVLHKIPEQKVNDLHDLLPQNWSQQS